VSVFGPRLPAAVRGSRGRARIAVGALRAPPTDSLTLTRPAGRGPAPRAARQSPTSSIYGVQVPSVQAGQVLPPSLVDHTQSSDTTTGAPPAQVIVAVLAVLLIT
jgi:hypothetical protein